MGQDIYGVVECRHSESQSWFVTSNLNWMSRWPEMQRKVFCEGDGSNRGLPDDASRETMALFGDAINYNNVTHQTSDEFCEAYSTHREKMEKHTRAHWDTVRDIVNIYAQLFGHNNTRIIVGFHP